MRNLKDIISERLVLSKDKQSNRYITFKELALYKMRDFNDHAYGDEFNTEDWCTPDNIYHGSITPVKTTEMPKYKSFTRREIESMLPKLSKFYTEHENDELLISDIKINDDEKYNVFKFKIENYVFNWLIYKRTFNV